MKVSKSYRSIVIAARLNINDSIRGKRHSSFCMSGQVFASRPMIEHESTLTKTPNRSSRMIRHHHNDMRKVTKLEKLRVASYVCISSRDTYEKTSSHYSDFLQFIWSRLANSMQMSRASRWIALHVLLG